MNVRQKRNRCLQDSDWEVIMAKEKGTTLSAGFKTYNDFVDKIRVIYSRRCL